MAEETILEEVPTQCLFAYVILEVIVSATLFGAVFFIIYILYILVLICLVIMQTSLTLPVGSMISSFHPSEGERALSPLHYRGDFFLILVEVFFLDILTGWKVSYDLVAFVLR